MSFARSPTQASPIQAAQAAPAMPSPSNHYVASPLSNDLLPFSACAPEQRIPTLKKHLEHDLALPLTANHSAFKSFLSAFYDHFYLLENHAQAADAFQTPDAVDCQRYLFKCVNRGSQTAAQPLKPNTKDSAEHPYLKEILGVLMVFGRTGFGESKEVKKEEDIVVIMSLLKRLMRPPEIIQEMAVRALINYSMNADNRVIIHENDGIKLVLNGMRIYSHNETMQLVSAWALRHLTLLTAVIQPFLETEEGLQDIFYAMSHFPEHQMLLEQASFVLYNVVGCEAGRNAILTEYDSSDADKKSGISIILSTLDSHFNQRKICEALVATINKVATLPNGPSVLNAAKALKTMTTVRDHWAEMKKDPNFPPKELSRVASLLKKSETVIKYLSDPAETPSARPTTAQSVSAKQGVPTPSNLPPAAPPKVDTEQEVLREGWLWQRRKFFFFTFKPNKRYCKLYANRLEYSHDGKTTGLIKFPLSALQECKVPSKNPSEIQMAFSSPSQTKMVFKTLSSTDANDWMKQISQRAKENGATLPATGTPSSPMAATSPGVGPEEDETMEPLADFTMSFTPFIEKLAASECHGFCLTQIYHLLEGMAAKSVDLPKVFDVKLPKPLILSVLTRIITLSVIQESIDQVAVPRYPKMYDLPALKSLCERITRQAVQNMQMQTGRYAIYKRELDALKVSDGDASRPRGQLAQTQGERPAMEDVHCLYPYAEELLPRMLLTTKNAILKPSALPANMPLSIFSICDGHGGVNCADYISEQLPLSLLTRAAFINDTVKTTKEAFLTVNTDYKEAAERLNWPNRMGSCALYAFIFKQTLFVAWTGDSSAVLINKDKTFDVVVEPAHKPSHPTEKARIEKAGGYVSTDDGTARVNGGLGVSRAFGDARYPCISCDPDMRMYPLNGNQSQLVMACNGLWDVFTHQEVATEAAKAAAENIPLAQHLVNMAIEKGSSDNVSVIVIDF